MLDFFTSKKKVLKSLNFSKKTSKHFPSPLREWKNSIYVYNKNSLNSIPSTTISTNNLIKSYFNLFNNSLEAKMRTKRLLLRLRRLSSNKYYISSGGFKHTNNKVLINLYVFNRQKKNYLLTLKNWYLKKFLKTISTRKISTTKNLEIDRYGWKKNLEINKNKWKNYLLKRKSAKKVNLKRKLLKLIRKQKRIWHMRTRNKSSKWKFSFQKNTQIKKLYNKINPKLFKKSAYYKLLNKLNLITRKTTKTMNLTSIVKYITVNSLKSEKNKKFRIKKVQLIKNYVRDFSLALAKKSLKKIKMYFFYKQLLYINRSKLNYTYLQYLKKHLENLYKKNVEFNIVNIKRFYLNSDILSESITNKLARNRRKMNKYLKNLRNKVEIKHKKEYFKDEKWSEQILNSDQDLSKEKILLQKHIVNELKYKHVTGYRLEAKGRLSKRFTASRSVSKLSYKGNLLDLYSSYKNVSSVVLKGNLKSNRQYTLLKSKSRIGSFGIRGWVSGN